MSVPAELESRIPWIRENCRKIFLDYDGTLVPIRMNPEECYPDDELLSILDSLNSAYELYIVTGRSLEEIRGFLGTRYRIIALHGALIMEGGEVRSAAGDIEKYRKECNEIFAGKSKLEASYPGLRVYNKNGNLLFHMGLVNDSGVASNVEKVVKDMSDRTGMEVYRGKMILELRVPGVNKGRTISGIRRGSAAMIAGDDVTDEEAFLENPDALRIKVGNGPTEADFSLDDYKEMREFLGRL